MKWIYNIENSVGRIRSVERVHSRGTTAKLYFARVAGGQVPLIFRQPCVGSAPGVSAPSGRLLPFQ